ncbi:MAG: hypothetical protein M3Y08_18455, partial [Fibrobacterota bacterium]|nr:hypothetical protein [Fibrobacterota bacterium]
MTLITVQSASAACLDSTFTVTASPYTPAAAGAINEHIRGCLDQTITVRLKYTGGDTLKIIGDILVTNRTGKFTNMFGVGLGDSVLTLVENDITKPRLLTVDAGNWTTLTDLGFARKAASPNSIATVLISADSSQIKGCHFWRLDNSSTGTEPLLDIAADSVLVERCLFRTPPDGVGRAIAIRTSGSANRVEIRSSVFYSTGLQLAGTGAVQVIANTFAGTRDKWEAIIVGTDVLTPEKNVGIQHNLFAHKADT